MVGSRYDAPTVRVGIIGTGPAAKVHCQCFQQNPNSKVVGVVGRSETKAKFFANSEEIPYATTDASDLIQSSDVDALVIAVPPSEQAKLATWAFESGKHVLCEKPLAVTQKEAREIERAWKRSGCVGMVNFCYRLIPEIEQLKRAISEGSIGILQSIHVDWILSNRLKKSLSHHWKGTLGSGGGVLQNYGSHVVDYLFHDMTELKVYGAKQEVFHKTRVSREGKEIRSTGDEITSILMGVDDGITALIHLSLVTYPPVGHRIIARGDCGVIEVSNLRPSSPAGPFTLRNSLAGESRRDAPSQGKSEDFDMATLFRRVVDRFVEAICAGEPAKPSVECGVKALDRVISIQKIASLSAQRKLHMVFN